MKKIIASLMILLTVLPMAGCQSGANEPLQKEVESLEKKAKDKAKKEKEEKKKAEKEAQDEKTGEEKKEDEK